MQTQYRGKGRLSYSPTAHYAIPGYSNRPNDKSPYCRAITSGENLQTFTV